MKRFLAAFLLLPLLAACGDDPLSPDISHVGVYQLQTVDGEELPVSFEEDGGVFTINSGSITLNANGTFAMTAQLEFTEEGETTSETTSLSGSYARSGANVTFTHDGEEEGFETAIISGDVLTTTGGGGEVLVFEK